MGNGWMIGSHEPPTVVNRWRRGVGATVVLELAIVVASCGPFGALPRRGPKSQTYEEVNKYPAIYQTCIRSLTLHRGSHACAGSTRHIYLAVMELSAATDLLRAAREDQQALTTGTVQLDGLVPHIHQASGMVAREERPHARAAP